MRPVVILARRVITTTTIGSLLIGTLAMVAAAQEGDTKKPGDRLSPRSLLATAQALIDAGPAAQGHASKQAVRALIVKRLKATGARVQEIAFHARVPEAKVDWQLVNLVASFNPAARRRLLLGGHWDTRPWADEDPDPARRGDPVPGANDGVSSTAILLELADLFSRRPPGMGVDVVLFDGEEGPKGTAAYFLGSRWLAERWTQQTSLPIPEAGVVLDMVGRRGQRIRSERSSRSGAPQVVEEIFAIARQQNARSFAPGPGGSVSDDHLAFLRLGIPVALLIDLNDPRWHTTADTIEHLDPAAMAEVGNVVAAWVRQRAAAAPR